MRRLLGNVLVMTGLILMAWPVIAWAYGIYWQQQLARDFDARVPKPHTPATAIVIRHGRRRVQRTEPAKLTRHPARAVDDHRAPAVGSTESDDPTPVGRTADADGDVPEPGYDGPLSWLRQEAAAWAHGTAVARLRIDRIGLNAVVVEGVGRVALRQGPGHVPGTGLPGDWTNCAIAAHRDAWFRRLHEVRPGDPIWIETPGSIYEYAVSRKIVVTPDRGDLLDQGFQPVLTLITCTGPGYPHSRYRLLVFCRLRAAFPR